MIQSRLTTVGKIFLSLIVLFYGAAVTSQSGLLLFFIGLIGGSLLANWFYARNVLQGLVVQAPAQAFLSEGAASGLPWKIINKGKRVAEQVDLFAASGRVFRIRVLSSGAAASPVPELAYARRGVYPNRELKLVTAAPFGLIQATRHLDLPGEVVVHPRIYEAAVPPVGGLDLMTGGKVSGKRRVASGANFAGVRLWQPGDPFKQIHWKSSARGQDLMVKTFEEELSGRLAVVLSCDGAATDQVDNCVRAAGSLLMTALEAGHQAAFWDPETNQFVVLPPFADGGDLLLALARYEPKPIRNWQEVAAKLPRKSTVALVATAARGGERSFLEALGHARRSSALYLPADASPASVESDQVFRFDP